MKQRNVGTLERWKECAALAFAFLSIIPSFHLSAQDTSTIDRGVRIGIIYRPGVRPGMVMLPRKGMGLDSVRAIVARDLDYSDRFEIISLPGGDSIRLATPSSGGTKTAHSDRTSSSALNYPLYQALGAAVPRAAWTI